LACAPPQVWRGDADFGGHRLLLTRFVTPLLYALLAPYTRPGNAIGKDLESALAERLPAEWTPGCDRPHDLSQFLLHGRCPTVRRARPPCPDAWPLWRDIPAQLAGGEGARIGLKAFYLASS
jgi:hypothetical protein